ncbi:MAG: class I SAM-dependent rRNA methyltransferase [Planctomycetes bacterium]|nr:class I SAM-dependent rRNA methyltransferase [Planctomycetota bacterium]
MNRPFAGQITTALERRAALLTLRNLDAARWLNGAGDGVPGLYVDQLGDQLVVHDESDAPKRGVVVALLDSARAAGRAAPRAIWWKTLRRDVRSRTKEELAPQFVYGAASSGDTAAAGAAAVSPTPTDPMLLVREGAWRFVVRPHEGYSHGLFLDQRDNRRRLHEWLARRAAAGGAKPGGTAPTLLNTFAYTCSFSVAAACAGSITTSVDLSARYLDWGRRNFAANAIDVEAHEFARGDALTFLEIAVKRGRRFDAIVLDPPTFSTSKQRGVFQVERDYGALAELALRVAAPGAMLLCSHNQRTFRDAALEEKLRSAARAAGRTIEQLEPFTPPADFPGPPAENPAARGCWLTVGS